MAKKILRIHVVIQRTGLSRSVIYEMMRKGSFPHSVKISSRSIGWREEEIDLWLDSLVSNKSA